MTESVRGNQFEKRNSIARAMEKKDLKPAATVAASKSPEKADPKPSTATGKTGRKRGRPPGSKNKIKPQFILNPP